MAGGYISVLGEAHRFSSEKHAFDSGRAWTFPEKSLRKI
jgi:hypothetical protein